MTRLRLALLAALAAAPAPGPAFAQQAPGAPAATRSAAPWQVDWGQYYCSAIRKADRNRPFATAFVMIPGMREMHIALIRQGGGDVPWDVSDVVLMPAGTRYGVINGDERAGGREIQRLYDLPLEFMDALAGAQTLELRSDGRVRERIPLDGVQDALAAHRRCLSEVGAEWGLDMAALAALSRRPNSTNHLGFTVEDYPSEALRNNSQGRVVMRIDVGADGRATACAPVASSGNRDMDNVSCQSAMTRARYSPALDAAGEPVASRAVFMATFRLPE